MKNQSIPAMLTVTFVAAIAGYSRGVYTQVNPGYDEPVRSHFSAEVEQVSNDSELYPLRSVRINHELPESGREHGSADENKSPFLVTVKKSDAGTYTITPLKEYNQTYTVEINDKLIGEFSSKTFEIPTNEATVPMKIIVTNTSTNTTARAYVTN